MVTSAKVNRQSELASEATEPDTPDEGSCCQARLLYLRPTKGSIRSKLTVNPVTADRDLRKIVKPLEFSDGVSGRADESDKSRSFSLWVHLTSAG